MLNFKNMMQQAQQMQFKLAEMQEKFKDLIVDGESGGGLIKVKMSCAGVVKGIDIDPAVIVPGDKETLEDLILAALGSATAAKDERVKKETEEMMGGLGLPAGMKLPF